MDTETIAPSTPKLNIPKSNNFELYQELKVLVEAYRGGLAALSQKISVSKPTLWRWVNDKNTKAPNAHNVLNLLKFLKKETDLHKIISQCPPKISQFLKLSFKADFERKSSVLISNDLNVLFQDFYFYLIHRLANTKKKMSRDDIKKVVGIYSLDQVGLSIEDDNLTDEFLIQLGRVADTKINKLIDYNLLTENNGIIETVIKNPKIDIEITKKYLPRLFKFFKAYNMSNGNNMLYSFEESISEEAMKKVLKIQYDAFAQCYEIMENEKCEDGEIYLLSVYFDSLNL